MRCRACAPSASSTGRPCTRRRTADPCPAACCAAGEVEDEEAQKKLHYKLEGIKGAIEGMDEVLDALEGGVPPCTTSHSSCSNVNPSALQCVPS